MQFKRMEQKSILHAILIGAASGLVGVALFVFLLQQSTTIEELVPVTEPAVLPAAEKLALYAAQHGTFSTQEAATNFMKGYPSLNLATVLEVDGQFYVWSELATAPQWDKEVIVPTSFVKALFVHDGQCEEKAVAAALVADTNVTLAQLGEQALPKGWREIVEAIGALTPNAKVVRLHVVAHYLTTGCLTVQF